MQAQALGNVRVLDLTRVLAGPWCTQTLADMGADVIKIEHPARGDDTRHWGPPYFRTTQGRETRDATYFASTNRNKRSVGVDIASGEGADLIRRLAAQCDVFIENFKVGDLARYGLDYDSIRAVNPAIVYCSITGYGQTGPYADRPGYDFVFQAEGGLMSITGEASGEPVRTGTSVVDLSTGAAALSGILAALYQRERTGEGQRIDVSLLGTTIAWMTYHAVAYFATGKAPGRTGSHHPSVSPYGGYPTKDGFLVVAIAFDSHWVKFCELVGRPELITDLRFASNPERVINRAELDPIVVEILADKSATEWAGIMDAAGIPCSPINDIAQALALPQVAFQDYVASVPHPDIPDLKMPGIPIKFSADPSSIRRHPPKQGEHTAEVLAELGCDKSPASAQVPRVETLG